jgi:flagellar protein FliS
VQTPYSQYRQSQIETTPKLKLIVMLYDGAIRFLQQSIPPMGNKEYEKKGRMINRAIAILSHLTGTLDFANGGELAINLCNTYKYLVHRLVEANYKNDPDIVNDVIRHLRELRESWSTVAAGIEAENRQDTKPAIPVLPKHLEVSLAA